MFKEIEKTHMSHIKTSSRLSITNTKKKCSCKSYLHLFSAWCLLLGVLDTSVCSGRDWVFHATSLRGCLGRMINFAMCVCFHFLSLIFQMFFLVGSFCIMCCCISLQSQEMKTLDKGETHEQNNVDPQNHPASASNSKHHVGDKD